MNPKVSVLTTVYNRVKYVDECIASVVASTLADFEYILVDDGSTDGSWEAVQAWVAQDNRVRVFRNEKNLGDYPNRNRAASLASGEYLKYVDSDDMIYPHGLAIMVGMMDQFPDAGLGLSAYADPEMMHPRMLTQAESYEVNFFQRDLFGRAPGSAIIRRSAFESAGGFSGLNQVGDHELWLKMASKFPVVTLPRDLVWDRTHGDQQQFLDSETKKARMHGDVQLTALQAGDCPLSDVRREEAIRRIWSTQAKSIARMILRGRVSQGAALRRALGLPWTQVISALKKS